MSIVSSVDEEIRVKFNSGFLCFDSSVANPYGVSYVRFLDLDGNEIAYWVCDEWSESPEAAEEVMGAIMGALCDVASGHAFPHPQE